MLLQWHVVIGFGWLPLLYIEVVTADCVAYCRSVLHCWCCQYGCCQVFWFFFKLPWS